MAAADMVSAVGSTIGPLMQLGLLAFSKDYRKSVTGSGLTTAQNQQNAFNAAEAEKARNFDAEQAGINREFNAAEAEKAWQRSEISADNAQARTRELRQTQYGDMVTGAQAAGINPMMLVGGMGMSATSGAQASAPAASGSAASGPAAAGSGGPLAQVSAIADLARSLRESTLLGEQIKNMRAERKNIEAQEAERKANTEQIQKNTAWIDRLNSATVAVADANASHLREDIGRIRQDIATGKADEALKRAGVSREEAQTGLLLAETVGIHIDNDNKQRMYDLDAKLKASQTELNESAASKNYAEVSRITKDIERIESEICLTYARALTEAYNQNKLDAETAKIIRETGLLDESEAYIKAQTREANAKADYTEIDRKGLRFRNACKAWFNLAAGWGAFAHGVSDAVGTFGAVAQ